MFTAGHKFNLSVSSIFSSPFFPREYRFVVECGIISVLFLFTFGNKSSVEKSDFLRWNLDDRRGSLLPGIDKLPLFDGG